MLATLRVAHDFVVLTNKKAQTAFSPFGLLIVELRGFGGAAHQKGFSEHSLRKPLARANAQPAFATSPRQPSRVRIPKLKAVIPRHKAEVSPLVELRGFEPLTFSLRTRRATNCAIAPRYSQKPKRVTGKFANHEAVGLRSRKITWLRYRQLGIFITI